MHFGTLGQQALAATLTPAGQGGASALGLHAGTEAVLTFARALRGLVSSFHGVEKYGAEYKADPPAWGKTRAVSNKPSNSVNMTKNFLLIDAHNVIFARPELATLHRRSPTAARESLLRLMERHQDATGVRVVVVFDGGQGTAPSAEVSGSAGVQVFYPRAGQSADAILEQLVLKYAAVHRLTVATGDNLIRTAAMAAGASTIDAESLFEEMDRAEKELGGALERLRRRR